MSTLVDLSPRVAVLGPVLVPGPLGVPVEPPSARGKALVVTLALASGESLSASRLVDDLWGDTPPRAGKAALQTLVSRLRQSCADDVIVSTPSGYALGGGSTTDLAVAASALDTARRAESSGDFAGGERAASDALALWRGDPGADLGGTEPADELSAHAAGRRSALLRVRAFCRLGGGDPAGCLDDLDAFGETGRRDDGLVALRLRALDAAGRRTDALRVFAEFRERLADELGADPSPELVRLNASLLQDPEPRTTASRLTIGLREAPNALIGRDADIARVEALLEVSRLVTILGPGGLGKTRLAQELGRRATATTPGVVVVELAGVRAEEDVALALATTLGIREAGVGRVRLTDPVVRRDVRELILTALSERPTLLVVDNCEHVIDAAATWIADIVASTTDVRVLATSRAPLAIGAERVHPLESLLGSAEPGGEAAAILLFAERARAARPGVALPRDIVARLCERLDGLPLAIELAAARVRSMSVDEIERRLGNRFALLTGGDRSAPERHRTLNAVIDWSWNLLGTAERSLLRRLSRFPDGFSAEAAQVVGGGVGVGVGVGAGAGETGAPHAGGLGDVPDVTGAPDITDITDALDGLVAQSLVQVAEDAASGDLRYRMLETVREFGDRELIRAGEADLVQDGMFRWAEAFSVDLRERLDGDDQMGAFTAMSLEQDNLATILRAALEAQRADICVSVFAALGYSWSLRGNQSDVASFGTAVLRVCRDYQPDEAHAPATALTFALGSSLAVMGEQRVSYLAVSRLRRLRASGPPLPHRLTVMIDILLGAVRGQDDLRAILPGVARSSDPVLAEIGSLLLSQMLENAGRVDEAVEYADRAYASASSLGHIWASATSASILAQLHAQRAEPERALVWAMRAREGLEAIGARSDLHELTRRMAAAEVALGRFDDAREIFEGILRDDDENAPTEREDRRFVALSGLAEIAFREGRVAESLERQDAVVRELHEGRVGLDMRTWPQLLLSSATAVAAHATREEVAATPEATDAVAQTLRVRMIAMKRLGTGFDDTPATGSAAFALAAWLLWPARPAPEATRALGLRLLWLALALNPRQDFGALQTAPLLAVVEARPDRCAVRRARDEATGLTPEEATVRVFELLADRRIRAPFDAV